MNDTRIYLSDPAGQDFDDVRMLLFMNDCFRDISTRARCISEQFLVAMNSEQVRYGLVDGFTGMRLVMYKYTSGWDELERRTLRETEILNGGFFRYQYPEGYDIWGKSHIEKIVSLEANSVDISGVPRLVSFTGTFESVRVGDIIIDLDDSQGQGEVLSVDTESIETQTTVGYSGLLGGASSDIAAGDNIRIVSPARVQSYACGLSGAGQVGRGWRRVGGYLLQSGASRDYR